MNRDTESQTTLGLLADENEQLRTALESALEENGALVDERDRLRVHISRLSAELRDTYAAVTQQAPHGNQTDAVAEAQRSQAEEELRAAYEELQVLTEELEVANSGLQHTNRELDERVEERTRQLEEINAVLRISEASLRAVADVVPDLLWRADRTGDADWFNKRWFAFTGQTLDHAIGMGWLQAVHPVDQAVTRTIWGIAVSSGKAYQHEHRIRDAAGDYRWFLVRAEPLRNERGRITHWFAAGTDIHDQRIALEALQTSETRFRTLIEGMPQLVWRAVDGGNWTWSSSQWSSYTGQSAEAARILGWLEMLHPDDRDAALAAWSRARDSGSLDFKAKIFHESEHRHRHFRTRALPVRDAKGRVIEWLGTSTDVDDTLQLQEQQAVLVGELQHRTRNLMGVVQAVTRRTLRDAVSLNQFEESIDDRLSALARVQSLLSRREGALRVPFDLLLREELSAHTPLAGDGGGAKVTLDGPSGIPLRSATVQTLALALHELATNAVKYGALSPAGGHLHVTWRVEPAGEHAQRLSVDWRETGVSDMPTREATARGGGYGRELIERALPYQLDARTSYAFEPEGVHCTIEVTVPIDDSGLEKNNG